MSNEKTLGQGHEFITLADLFGVLRSRILPIILAALLFGAATYGITCIMPKEYSATSSFYVRNMPTDDYTDRYGVTSSQTGAAQDMAQDFARLVLRSDKLLDNAIAKHGLACTREQLRKMLETDVESKSAIFYVTVTSKDQAFAAQAAKAIEAELPAAITEIAWGVKADPAKNEGVFSCVALLQEAMDAHQSAPRYKLLTALGTMAGAMIAYIAFLLLFLFGSTVYNEEDLSRVLPDYPIVGRIPHWGFSQIQQNEEDA